MPERPALLRLKAPKTASSDPWRPKTVSRRAKTRPSRPKTPPRCPKRHPRPPKTPPKDPPETSQNDQDAPPLPNCGGELSLLGASWGGLGGSWGILGRSWAALGASMGDPKSIKKSIRKSIRNRAGSRRKKMAQTLRLSMFQSLTRVAATQIQSDSKSIDTAFDMISSYLSIDSLPRRPNHNLT